MRITPHKVMQGLRFGGIAAGVSAVIALAGPFKYEDLGLPFPDTVAHAVLFYGVTLAMLTSLPEAGTADTSWVVSVQVAASAAGNAVLPAAIGLVIGAWTGAALGPSLLALSVVLLGLYAWLTRGRPGQPKLRRSKD